MDAWYQSELGRAVVEFEHAQLKNYIATLTGNYLLQLGGPKHFPLVSESPMRRKLYVTQTDSKRFDFLTLQSALSELPLSPGSVDLVLVPHSLEGVAEPKKVLKEIYHALVPGGQVIILGFNALSMWNIDRWWWRKQGYPWDGKFHNAHQMKQWLYKNGLSTIASHHVFYRMPYQQGTRSYGASWFETLGQTIFPWFGGVYILIAQKRLRGMTALPVVEWGKKMVINTSFVEPSTRVGHE